MTPDEMIAVLQAHKEGRGRQIECRTTDMDGCKWVSATHVYERACFDFKYFDYRVKKSEPREWFIGNWVDLSASGYSGDLLRVAYTKEQADARISGRHNALIHVREVME